MLHQLKKGHLLEKITKPQLLLKPQLPGKNKLKPKKFE